MPSKNATDPVGGAGPETVAQSVTGEPAGAGVAATAALAARPTSTASASEALATSSASPQ